MKTLCDGEVIFYSSDPEAPALTAHRADNGRALFVRNDQVVLASGATQALLPGLGKVSSWRARHAHHKISENTLLAAIGTAWALDIPLKLISAGMEAFELNEKPAGRAA
jgi:cyanophycin synthetase